MCVQGLGVIYRTGVTSRARTAQHRLGQGRGAPVCVHGVALGGQVARVSVAMVVMGEAATQFMHQSLQSVRERGGGRGGSGRGGVVGG